MVAQVKRGDENARYGVTYAQGSVRDVDPKTKVAIVRLHDKNVRVRVDQLHGKSAPPRPGERWILSQDFDLGWTFAVCLGYTADLDWIQPTLTNPWTGAGAPYLPVGYRREVEGFVTLCGRLSGGTANTKAFVLPEKYRPGGTWAPHNGPVSITAVGVVSPTATAVSLDGVRFFAQK